MILAVHKNETEQTMPVSILSWRCKNNPESGAQQFGSRDEKRGDMRGTVGLNEQFVQPDFS